MIGQVRFCVLYLNTAIDVSVTDIYISLFTLTVFFMFTFIMVYFIF